MKKGKIVYGIVWKNEFSKGLEEGKNPEYYGFSKLVLRKGIFNGFLGVSLSNINDLNVPLDLRILSKYAPSKEDIKLVNEMINKLPESLKILITKIDISLILY